MAGDIAQWNLLQVAFIAVYPAWMSYVYMPSGMSLLSAYLNLLVLCIPPVFIQLKLGNHQQMGVVKLLSKHIPIFKGVGVTLLIQLFLICVYMVPRLTHYGMYAFISLVQHPYVWSGCGNVWNTPRCTAITVRGKGPEFTVNNNPPNSFISPELDFFDHEYLQVSGNISDVRGFAKWHFTDELRKLDISIFPLAMNAVWLFIFLSIAFGGRVCGWILFILGPAFLTLIFTVMGYGYSNLASNGTDVFLHDLYTLDLDQFSHLQQNAPVIAYLAYKDCGNNLPLAVTVFVLLTVYNFAGPLTTYKDWLRGFKLVMHALPIWVAILPTMGKMTGTGRLSRNISWVFVILVYAATCQLPQLSIAPYIGNLEFIMKDFINKDTKYSIRDFDSLFTTVAAAFATLDIPPVYATLFYLSIFIAGLMFMIVAMFTILDNIVEGMMGWSETFQERKGCVTFCAGFVLISVGIGAAILHTTQAGVYYIILMDQCVFKLYFLTVALYGLSLIIVYAKQNFSIVERILMSMWLTLSTVTTTGFYLYIFVLELDQVPEYHGVRIKGTWDLVCWVFASAPYLAIPAAMVHSCQQEEGSCFKRLKYVFCGIKPDQYDPPQDYGYHRPEPSAPPYGNSETYTYMDEGYPMMEVPYYATSHDK